MTQPTTHYAVFCDVDETLIRPKSMLDFLDFFAQRAGKVGAELAKHTHTELAQLRAAGAPREALNRAYYRAYAGQPVRFIHDLADDWYAQRNRDPAFYIAATRRALTAHRKAGASIVLVSGSFVALLAPIARAVGAEELVCTHMLAQAGVYTGEIDEPVIGQAKGAAVGAYLARHSNIDPARCFAYADDVSDIPMLERVGNPRVVGDNPSLRQYRASDAEGCRSISKV